MAAAIQKFGHASNFVGSYWATHGPARAVGLGTPPHLTDSGRLAEIYESGGLLLFSKPDLPIATADWAFLDSLPSPRCSRAQDEKRFKKAKLRDIMWRWKPGHVLEALGFDEAKAKRLQAIIPPVNERLRAIVPVLFPGYKVVRENISWRLTETGPEEPHYDSYGYEEDELHTVRIFVNLDNEPRRWAVGPPVGETLRKYPNVWAPYKDRHPNIINDKINKMLPWSEIPMGEISFAPGALWLVNSQIVAHAILWGRRMVAATFKIDPKTMACPEKNFVTVARKAMA